MGFISRMAATEAVEPIRERLRSRAAWREVFGSTTKETGNAQPKPKESVAGGAWGRSALSGDYAIKRLVQAMRSMAPGGWTDDRYAQSQSFFGVVYTAIHRTGEQLMQAEFNVFKRDIDHPDGKRPITRNDPPEGDRMVRPWDLVELLQKPNNDDSFGDLMYSLNQQMDLTGMGLTWMVPNQLGTPMELYVVPTATAIPQPAINPDFPDGYYRIQPLYPYGPFSSYPTPTTAVGAPIPAQWMLRMKYQHPLLRYEGYSPMTAMRLYIDAITSMDNSRWYAMKRSINPSAVLQCDLEGEGGTNFLPEEEINRLKAEFEADFEGPENAGRLFIANGGKLEPWGNKPIDMDYPAGWDQMTSFLMGAGFGVSKPAAGMIEDSSYSVLYATLKQLYWQTLDPKCHRVGAKFTRHLAPYFGDDLIVEVRCRPINDHEIVNGKISTAISAKAITKNEVRKMLDMEVTKEEWGDEIAGKEDQEQQQPGAPPGGTGIMPPDGKPKPISSKPKPPDQEPGEENPAAAEAESEREEPSEVTKSRPRPGGLGKDSLGPRMKRMIPVRRKSVYDQVREAIRNGSH